MFKMHMRDIYIMDIYSAVLYSLCYKSYTIKVQNALEETFAAAVAVTPRYVALTLCNQITEVNYEYFLKK